MEVCLGINSEDLNTLNLTPLWSLLIHRASQAVFTRCLHDSGDTQNTKTNMVVFCETLGLESPWLLV